MTPAWHQLVVSRAAPSTWHTELERAAESNQQGHGVGEVALAALPARSHRTGWDTNDSAMRTRIARQGTQGAAG